MNRFAWPGRRHHRGLIASLILVSNRPRNVEGLLDNIERTVADPKRIEVIIKIDHGDGPMRRQMEVERKRRRFALRVLTSAPPESHFTLWKSINDLHRMVDPSAYFVSNINDEVRYLTPGWDEVLGHHVGIFEDDLYRLRVSRFKLHNYFDVWECWYAPENFGFHTKRWIDVQGDWNACHVSDSFQQMVSYYLALGSYPGAFQLQRDVPIWGIEMDGQEAAEGLTPAQAEARDRGNDAAWYVIMSPEMQTEICRRARLIQGHIWAHQQGHVSFTVSDDRDNRRLEFVGPRGECLIVFSYRLDDDRIRQDVEAERARGELFHYRRDLNFMNELARVAGPQDGRFAQRIFHTSRSGEAATPSPASIAVPAPGAAPVRRMDWARAVVGNARRDPSGFARIVFDKYLRGRRP